MKISECVNQLDKESKSGLETLIKDLCTAHYMYGITSKGSKTHSEDFKGLMSEQSIQWFNIITEFEKTFETLGINVRV